MHYRPKYTAFTAALVMLSPLVAGTFFGVKAVFGLLTGGLVSGVQLAISMSNSGGAWDNAKMFVHQVGVGKGQSTGPNQLVHLIQAQLAFRPS